MNERIKLAVCALMIHENKLLIMKRSATDDFLPGVWEFPGGSIDKGETAINALVREIKEETGIDISCENIKLVGISEEITPQEIIERYVQFNYEVMLSKKVDVSISDEHSDFDWICKCDERIDDFLRDIIKQSEFCRNWIVNK